jgi:hypothetical protein
MKRRPSPRPPPIVVTKPTRRTAAAPAPAAPRRAAPDRKIKIWHAEDPERQERDRFERKTATEQWEEAYTWWDARYQRANDPDVRRQIARFGVARDILEAALSHIQRIKGGGDERWVLRARKGQEGLMDQALHKLLPTTKSVATDPRGTGPPAKFSLLAYIRGLRGKKD